MGLFSKDWIWIFAIIVLVLFLKLRRNRVPSASRGKQLSIVGKKILTPYTLDTPLICLLSDNKNFGSDYQTKEEPKLPHEDGCKCFMTNLSYSSADLFKGKKMEISLPETDLGKLNDAERRYYRYCLVVAHPNATEEQKENFVNLSKNIEIDDQFKQRINNHLDLSNQGI